MSEMYERLLAQCDARLAELLDTELSQHATIQQLEARVKELEQEVMMSHKKQETNSPSPLTGEGVSMMKLNGNPTAPGRYWFRGILRQERFDGPLEVTEGLNVWATGDPVLYELDYTYGTWWRIDAPLAQPLVSDTKDP